MTSQKPGGAAKYLDAFYLTNLFFRAAWRSLAFAITVFARILAAVLLFIVRILERKRIR